MPVHPEMIGGTRIYDPAIRRAIEAIGPEDWESLSEKERQLKRLEIIDRERAKLREAYRRLA
jgi:hypothetical protein